MISAPECFLHDVSTNMCMSRVWCTLILQACSPACHRACMVMVVLKMGLVTTSMMGLGEWAMISGFSHRTEHDSSDNLSSAVCMCVKTPKKTQHCLLYSALCTHTKWLQRVKQEMTGRSVFFERALRASAYKHVFPPYFRWTLCNWLSCRWAAKLEGPLTFPTIPPSIPSSNYVNNDGKNAIETQTLAGAALTLSPWPASHSDSDDQHTLVHTPGILIYPC